MPPFTTILVDTPHDNVTRITLNRPHCLNAINAVLLDELCIALRQHGQSRVIVLTGAGNRSFCAGEDLKEGLAPVSGSAEELRVAFDRLQDLTRLTSMASAIVVAAVQGFAIGGGAEIALGCDFVIGGPNTVFRFPEVPIGHAATGGITARLTSIVGLFKAKELLIRGRFIKSEEASRIGLLTELVDDPQARALELAEELAALPRVSAMQSKMSLERGTFPNMEAILQDEVNAASICFAQADSAKAFSDFAARKAKTQSSAQTSAAVGASSGHRASADTANKIKNLSTALEVAAKNHPERIFLRFTRPSQEFTYGQFKQRVTKLALGLRGIGVQPGEKVLVMMQTCPEAVEIWFAANRIGAVWVPINTELKAKSLKHVLMAAKAKMVITGADCSNAVCEAGVFADSAIYTSASLDGEALATTRRLEDLYIDDTPTTSHAFAANHPSATAALLFTSGTTGGSKACILSHEYFFRAAHNLSRAFGFTALDILYCPFPLFHADATSLTIVPALLLGATAALSPRFSVSRFWDEIRETQSTVYDFMGATLGLLWKAPPTGQDRQHSVRLAWGVPIPSWAVEYEKRFGHKIAQVYGSMEAGLPIAQPLDEPQVKGSCGRIIADSGYSIRIADDYDDPVDPPTKMGNLLLRSDTTRALFDGYYDADQETAFVLRGTWFHTGDLARVDSEGNLFFMGRTKDAIRRRGEMISAFLVEEEILVNPAVKLCAAVGVPSHLGEGAEEDVKLLVVRNESEQAGREMTEKGLWEWCRARMPKFMVPDYIEIVGETELEITETGKVSKKGIKREVGVAVYFDARAGRGEKQ